MDLSRHRPDIPWSRQLVAIIVAATLLPVAHFSYLLAVFWLNGYPFTFEPFPSAGLFLYVLTLALTGGITLLDWYWGLRFAPAAAIVAFLVFPWMFHASIGEVDYGAIPFVAVLISTGFEGTFRFPERMRRLTTGTTGRFALAAGLLHFGLGFGLQVYARRFFWMNNDAFGIVLTGLVYTVSGLALVAAAALAVFLWRRERLASPVLVTSGWFLWGLYGTWQIRDSLPLSPFVATSWIGLQPYPGYMQKWTVLMIALLTVAGFELAARRAGRNLGNPKEKSTT